MQYLKYRFNLKNRTRLILAGAFYILALLCMVMIFIFSMQNGNESQKVSDTFADKFLSLLKNLVGIGVIRKLAHFTEYAALGFLLSSAFLFSRKRFSANWAFLVSFIYSITDEIHQIFVPERAGRVFDVFVDSSGAIFGILVFTLLLFIINYFIIKKSSRNKKAPTV